MYSIGFDIGSSSVKVALINSQSGESIFATHEPSNEMEIFAPQSSWAEQDPEIWWKHLCNAIKKVILHTNVDVSKINGIGISYQMHGLVLVDANGQLIRDSIIWCDSRAIETGKDILSDLGEKKCVDQLLNTPGNFTFSKLKWVKDNEPENFNRIHKILLPGDYIAYKLTGEYTTTKLGLSEGIMWDFSSDSFADWIFEKYNIPVSFIPTIVDNFASQGKLTDKAAIETGLHPNTPIYYRAGDQPNNALALNVLRTGEVATTGGTSGVFFALTNDVSSSSQYKKLNTFPHVNYASDNKVIGKLLCINGAGIHLKWIKNLFNFSSYDEINQLASKSSIGSKGLIIMPFGNGAERMFENVNIGASFGNINHNIHSTSEILRASLEGIAFSFVYGVELLIEDGVKIEVLKTGNDNLYRSEIFSETIATLLNVSIEIYNTTGSIGAARAVNMTKNDYKSEFFENDLQKIYKPKVEVEEYRLAYLNWKKELTKKLDKLNN